jgi:hypothetical protein
MTCYKTFKSSAHLSTHKQDVKKGKGKCVPPPPSFNDGPISSLEITNKQQGAKSMFN